MMENRKKIGLIIIGIALVILLIIIILFLNKDGSKGVTPGPELISNTGQIDNSGSQTPITPSDSRPDNYKFYDVSQKERVHTLDGNDAAKLSSSFTERLGSFSNQSDYGNMTDLKIFMTSAMRDWTDKEVATLKAADYSGEYYGITTKALTTKVLNYDEKSGKAKVEVMTERREGRADTLSEAFPQKMTLDLIENDGQWLVDGAYWEKK